MSGPVFSGTRSKQGIVFFGEAIKLTLANNSLNWVTVPYTLKYFIVVQFHKISLSYSI